MKGMSKELCSKLIIKTMTDLFTEYEKQDLLINRNRPGPNYYDDCIQFNWVSALKDRHKTFMENNGDFDFY